MSINDLLEKWISMANEDFEVSKLLYNENKFLISAFHLQQAVEKYLKAYYILKKNKQPSYIHNLYRIAEEADLLKNIPDDLCDLFDDLSPYYIQARYPTYKQMLSLSLNKELVNNLIIKTKRFILWLKKQMK